MSTAPGRPGRPGRPGALSSRWRWPVAQLLALSLIVITDSAVVDHRRADVAADLAAERGAGPRVAVRPVAVRHAAPFVVEVPRLGIRSRLVDLHRTPTGALEVPADPSQAGWYVGSSHPGDAGPTVLAGHVDSYEGPGVFFHLDRLRHGDRIVVRRSDRTTAVFVVQRVLVVPKRRFPTALVYRGDGRPSLRLVTCGGTFSRTSKHYSDNVVVLAVPA